MNYGLQNRNSSWMDEQDERDAGRSTWRFLGMLNKLEVRTTDNIIGLHVVHFLTRHGFHMDYQRNRWTKKDALG